MKPALAALGVLVLLGAAVTFAVYDTRELAATNRENSDRNAAIPKIDATKEAKNPWTHLRANNQPQNFQFAILTDRTGGRRPGVFTRGIEKVNLLQPEFVVSVGDLIEGYTENPGQWALEWSELESKVEQLQMPFFFCPGNHDISNLPMSREWNRKFGRSYYQFKYQNVLFLVLNTEDKPSPLKKPPYYIGEQQRRWAKKVLNENKNVRWTFVILHKPAWYYTSIDHKAHGWEAIEGALKGRGYTVFAGHNHRYGRYIRNGREHYILATTGGAARMNLGFKEGYFDHFVWVTMKGNRPVIANLLLSGVHDKNVRNPPLPNPITKRFSGKKRKLKLKPKRKKP